MRQPTLFLACPIGQSGSKERERSDRLLKYVVGPVAAELNCELVRADKMAEPGRITLQIAIKLNSADVVIADLTGLNPNVMYELGVRQALGRPCILMAEAGQSLPFDLLDFRTIFYKLELEGVEEAKAELKSQISSALAGGGAVLSRNLYECPPVDGGGHPSQSEVLDEILNNVRMLLSRQLSTKYLGTFPHFFEQNVADCIEEAQRRILIACDFPAPGVFSAPEGFEKYIQALERKRAKGTVSVQMLILNKERRDELNRLLIPEDREAWAVLTADQTKPFARNLASFNERHQVQIDSPNRLYEMFERLDALAIERLTNNVAEFVYEIDSLMPMYVWVVDSKRAIFSIPTFPDLSDKSSEKIEASYGFETRNGELVTALERIWQWYYKMRIHRPALESPGQ